MLFKSIRWRLQLWYGVMLVAVLIGFGFTAYQLERNRRLHDIDAELQHRLEVLSRELHFQGPDQGGWVAPFAERPIRHKMDPGPPDPDFPPDHPPPRDFALTPQTSGLFGGSDPAAYYYIIWRRDSSVMSKSANAPLDLVYGRYDLKPGNSRNAMPPGLDVPASNRSQMQVTTDRKPSADSFRERSVTTPPGEILVVGRSMAGDLAELQKFGWSLAGFGAVVLLLGLAGGWRLATRAIRPIEDISATAVKIAAGDLAQRINIEDTDNELGRLAGVLNSTFARLETSFAQQAQFTADAAHELRTPVTVILAQTQTSLKRERNSAEYRDTVEACQRAAQRMRRLLELLLELARLDAGQEPM
ncbi:MAG: hypothetical protein JWQ04_2296, partial [Pedosphaera sp.]|nr:hypothetical protein [Pedosphaera sp.]